MLRKGEGEVVVEGDVARGDVACEGDVVFNLQKAASQVKATSHTGDVACGGDVVCEDFVCCM